MHFVGIFFLIFPWYANRFAPSPRHMLQSTTTSGAYQQLSSLSWIFLHIPTLPPVSYSSRHIEIFFLREMHYFSHIQPQIPGHESLLFLDAMEQAREMRHSIITTPSRNYPTRFKSRRRKIIIKPHNCLFNLTLYGSILKFVMAFGVTDLIYLTLYFSHECPFCFPLTTPRDCFLF